MTKGRLTGVTSQDQISTSCVTEPTRKHFVWKRIFDRGDIMGIRPFVYKIRSSLTVSNDVTDIKEKIRKTILKQFSLQQMLHHQHLIDDIINKCRP